MVDPDNITEFGASQNRLEEILMFWVFAAGKNAKNASRSLERLLKTLEIKGSPFELLRRANDDDLAVLLKEHGVGCYKNKARTIGMLARSNFNLKTCSLEDLEGIWGIGPKTARCFLMHSRPNQEYAGLDVHILRFLRDKGYNAPKNTPSGKKKYRELERAFIEIAKKSGLSVADFDLAIWRKYRVA